ncbi:MAG: septation protein IspZ, partial [Pseudomonadota bacterium]|nr:septation protein IspZ [Pseudomonadota bacterium]
MTETPPNKEETEKSWVKPATEYGPLAVFLITYYGAGIYAATAALMGATAIALTFSFVINRRLPLMPIITAVIVGIFGALTLIFQDDTFIKV